MDLFYEIESHVNTDDGDYGDLVNRLFKHQLENNEELSRVVKMYTDGESGKFGIPPVDVRMFKTIDMRSFSGEASEVWTSSGTTGSVSRTPLKDTAAYDVAIDTCLPHSLLERLETFSTSVTLVPTQSEWPNSSLAYMFDRINRKLGFEVVRPLSVRGTSPGDLSLTEYSTDEDVVIFTTSYMGVKAIESGRLKAGSGSIIVDTGGYKGVVRDHSREEFRSLVEERLGLKAENILSEYGMSEMSSQMWSEVRDGEELWRVPKSIEVEILNPDDEGVGQVALYDLFNIWSVCAIKTQDLGQLLEVEGERFFKPHGRMKNAEAKGCSLTAERAFGA